MWCKKVEAGFWSVGDKTSFGIKKLKDDFRYVGFKMSCGIKNLNGFQVKQ